MKSLPSLPLCGTAPVVILLGLCCALLSVDVPATKAAEIDWLPSSEQWTEERTLYQKAAAELDSGAGNRYQEMRDALADYPLAVDLDFSVKLGQLHDMTAAASSLDWWPTNSDGKAFAEAPPSVSARMRDSTSGAILQPHPAP